MCDKKILQLSVVDCVRLEALKACLRVHTCC